MKTLKRFLRKKETIIGLIILGFMAVVGAFAPLISPGDALFSVAAPMQKPSAAFWFGTDDIGRDVFGMVVWGARISMIFAFGAAGLSLIIGVLLGAISGYVGGVFDDVLSRIFEVFYIIPRTFLIILMVAIFGSSVTLMVIIVGITSWPSNAKIMRAQVLTLKSRGYVQAAEVAGGKKFRILFRHIVPNGIGPVISNSTLQMAQAVLTEASLSFLGLGDANVASWGKILQAGQKHISSAPWLVIIPGIVIALMILAFNLLGNSLQSTLNVKQQIYE